MTVDEFVSKYLNLEVGFPKEQYKGECLSLVKRYIQERFGIYPPASGCNAARCYWSNFPDPLGSVFKKVPNTWSLLPKKGWIPVWDSNAGGGYGHISVWLEGGLSTFVSFDQNWGGRHAHKVTHNYNNISGFLAPIDEEPGEGDDMPSPQPEPQTWYVEGLGYKTGDELVAEYVLERQRKEDKIKELAEVAGQLSGCSKDKQQLINDQSALINGVNKFGYKITTLEGIVNKVGELSSQESIENATGSELFKALLDKIFGKGGENSGS